MKVIGKRTSTLKKTDLLSIVILPTEDKKKLIMMFLWLFAWTVCGVLVFINYFSIAHQDTKQFIIVYLSFWAYYEFKIARAFLWKKWGREKLWIQSGTLHYQRELNGKGKINEYNLDLINDLKLIDVNPGNFSDFFNQSFWVKGGERLEFSVTGKAVRFGMQLSTEEARAILSDIREFLKA